jgi:sugar O-acyltransferase (sialic acid O-acetyltransferase NeuD family)
MRKPLYIYGAGGLGREVLAMVHLLDEWEPKGFIDDNAIAGSTIKNLPVYSSISALGRVTELSVVIAIGDPLIRRKIAGQLPTGVACPIIKHPKAEIIDQGSVVIGKGCIVSAGVVLTTDIIIGEHVLINLNATIGHDVRVGSFSSIMPSVNIAGGVTIGEAVLLGSGSNVRNGVYAGNNSKIGMGAVVIRNVNEGDTVVGVPAKPIRGTHS